MTFHQFINTVYAPIALATIMFGMGLGLRIHDFARITTGPRAEIIGLAGQLVLLPALAIAASLILPLPPAIAVGLIIIAACPGGISSNALVFAVRADLALSITLTAVASVVTVFTLPLIVSWGLDLHMAGGEAPALPVGRTITRLFLITVLPVALGMAVAARAQNFAARAVKFFRPAGIIIVLSLIIPSIIGDLPYMGATFAASAPLSILFNAMMLALGYGLARGFGLDREQTITIAIEIGIQNVAIAIFVVLSILESRHLAAVPVIYGVFMYLNATVFLVLIKRRASAEGVAP